MISYSHSEIKLIRLSRFGNQAPRDLDQPKASVASWLFERKTVLASRMRTETDGFLDRNQESREEMRDIELKMQEFCKPFALLWPKKWKTKVRSSGVRNLTSD